MQKKHEDWVYEWSKFKDSTQFLFQEWIYPHTLNDFQDKRVLDAGCGPGHHVRLVAPFAREVVGMDLNTGPIAREELKQFPNVTVWDEDLARAKSDRPFDMVYCVGVIPHTDNPDQSFENLKNLTRKGGILIIWACSFEGNFLNRTLVEWLKRKFILKLPKQILFYLAAATTLLLYPFVWTIYLLPFLKMLPFYEYFGNFRKLTFKRNMQNVFDRLNAPQTIFITKQQMERWFNNQDFDQVHVSSYKGISWRGSGIKK